MTINLIYNKYKIGKKMIQTRMSALHDFGITGGIGITYTYIYVKI